jgi:hypothetical protein
MQGQYPGNHAVRPRGAWRSAHHDALSARLFLCAGCRAQSVICSCCDRGQIYCAGDCAARARHRAQRAAGQRCQTSRRGRLAHADRTRRYRARCKKVTHHGSPEPLPDDLLPPASPAIASDAEIRRSGPGAQHRTAIGAGVAARNSSVGSSCVAASIVAAWCDTTGQDPTMVTPPDIEAQILRYYHVEKWRVGTIAGQLHVHHSVVKRVLAQAGLPRIGPPARPSQIDVYLPFIRQTLETFPTLTASRLYGMVRERGYRGSPDHFRHVIACHRPRPPAEAYLRLRCLPGEQAQVDWGHFGHLEIGRARRPLMAFIMVLSHSRQIFLRFFLDARMENFLRGHVAAFSAWNGVPRVLLYDNLKSVVLDRRGDAIRFRVGPPGYPSFGSRPTAAASLP